MRKRLRKKLRTGEFTQWGFLLQVKYRDTDDREQQLEWIFDVLALCEQRNWMAGGAGTLFIVEYGYGTLTEDTVGAFCADLMKLPGVQGYRRSKLVDSNDPRYEDARCWPPLLYRN